MNWLFSTGGLSILFQVVMLVHFFRNRPEFYWFFVILFFGPIGAAVYFFVEVLPDFRWKIPAIEGLERGRRKTWLEKVVSESPSQEAVTELAQIHAHEGDHRRAFELFSQALRRDPEDADTLYGRGLAAKNLEMYPEAVKDLRQVVEKEPAFRFHQAALTLADTYEQLGDDGKAIETYRAILDRTTVSEAYFGLGLLLAKQGKTVEARRMVEEIVSKQAGLPHHLRRRERPWVRRARAFLKTLE